jgi:hypothetical protein
MKQRSPLSIVLLVQLCLGLIAAAIGILSDASQRPAQANVNPQPREGRDLAPATQSGQGQSQDQAGLFSDAPNVSPLRVPDSPQITRSRFVRVNFDQLGAPAEALASQTYTDTERVAAVSRQITLNLFDDVTVMAQLDHLVRNESGTVSWMGHLVGVPFSTVILTVGDGLLYGAVNSPGGAFEIRQISGETHVIQEINQAAFNELPDTPLAPQPRTQAELAAAAEMPMADNGSVIDVLVAYTDDARTGAGGTANIQALIDSAINTSNATYGNSGIAPRIRLVASIEVNYAETISTSADLNNLRNGLNGLQIVRDVRNAYAADLTIMIVERLESNIAGRAFDVMSTVSTAFATDAYAVVKRDQAVGNLSFPHELGHLMGARHDWFDDATNNQPYSFNHGFVFTSVITTPWRTVMAYNDRCAPGSCTRIAFWSNPDIVSGTTRMGVYPGTSTGCTAKNAANPACDADNRLTLNNTAVTVSNFSPGNLAEVYANPTVSCIPLVGCFEFGTSAFPYDTLTEAAYRAAPGATVWINPGNYPETLVLVNKTPRGLVINRPMTLRVNSAGTAVIGP